MTLNGHRGHFIDSIESESRAERAGLKHGDLVLEVNGDSISNRTHDDVVDIIKLLAQNTMMTRLGDSCME